jgi:effector-binding domain-containing protein
MTVEFEIRKSPAYRVAAVRWKGPWSDGTIHRRFDSVVRWAKSHGLRTGKWIFREPAERTWEVAVEVRGSARSEGDIRIKSYPACSVARVIFDPDVVSPPVVYHGLSDWLRWRRRDKTIRSVGDYREVYDGDPWRDKRAYAHTEVQYVVRR